MRKKETMLWIPLYVDKYLFGSMRSELQADEQAVWTDFLCLGGKDEGFIRANVGFPYSEERLAGLLARPEELIHRTIEKCLRTWTEDPDEKPKLTKMPDGTLYVTNWAEYQFSDRYVRMIRSTQKKKAVNKGDAFDSSAFPEVPSAKAAPIGKDRKRKDKKGQDNMGPNGEDISAEFEKFWDVYPQEGRHARAECLNGFRILVGKGELKEFIQGFNGYMDFLKHKEENESFKQHPMYARKFLDNWREYVGFEFKPRG